MTLTRGSAKAPSPDARQSHVPGDGTTHADAVEQARKAMLADARPRNRTRIGADVLCEALLRQGVDVFFSYPGGVILPLYDVLGDYPEIRHILVRHEQGGAHAADGFARATGQVGVCMGTSGPGATNLVTGIGTAQLDSVPIVAITGNVPAALIGKDAFQEIARARRPVILAGHGVLHAGAWDDLKAFAEKTQIPIAHTLLGIGAVDETHPLSYGYMGMHGWKHVNKAIQSADLLLAIGMRFDDRVTGNVRTYAPYARIVHVDIDPAEIGKNVAVEVPIVGDAKRVLGALLPMVEAVHAASRREYFDQLAEWRRESEASSWHGSGAWRDGLLSADFVVARIGELSGHAGTYVADVGQNQMWLARYTGFRQPNTHVSSGGLGTMGFSVPAAMGAALGRPDRETWAITGDGGFQMTSQELMTLVQDRIPLKIALLDNKKLGMIRQWQEIIYGGNYHSAHLPGPDFAKLADAFGIPAWRISKPDEVDATIRAAQAVDGPALIWFEIAEEQNVFPMMPAGKGLSDLIETWGGADE